MNVNHVLTGERFFAAHEVKGYRSQALLKKGTLGDNPLKAQSQCMV